MSENKTKPTEVAVEEFLAGVEPDKKRQDALTLDAMFRDVTGWNPVMWGPSMIGYRAYHYVYESGHEGDSLATGFSPRKANLSIFIMPGYAEYGSILDRLGKHKMGKSCLYINKLADVDLDVLAELVKTGLTDLDKKWPVRPS